MDIRVRLQKLLTDRDTNPARVAKAIGESPTTVGRWFKGVNDIPLSQAAKLADHFDVSLDTLAGLDPPLTDGEREVLRLARLLGEHKAINRLLANDPSAARADPRQEFEFDANGNVIKPTPDPHRRSL